MITYYFVALMVGLVISLMYWFGESLIHVHIFHSGSLYSQMFPHDMNEVWMRLMLSFLLIMIVLLISVFMRKKVQLSEKLWIAYQALDSIREGCVITNFKQEIIYINPRYEEITGYSMREVLGKNPTILSSGKQDALFYKSMWSSIQTCGYWEGEIWNRTKSGELFPEWINISCARNRQGKPTYYVGLFTNVSSKKESDEKLAQYAYYDPLTNLPNRRLLIERLNHSIKNANRNHQKLAVLFLDLDYFKAINDQYGHMIGDVFLCEIGSAIKKQLRESDTLSRFGGDEFVLLLPDIKSKESAVNFAKKLLSHFDTLNIIIESHVLNTSFSIGGAVYPDDALDAETLIAHADSAMYQVKHALRHDVFFGEAQKK